MMISCRCCWLSGGRGRVGRKMRFLVCRLCPSNVQPEASVVVMSSVSGQSVPHSPPSVSEDTAISTVNESVSASSPIRE